jgi:hypothetical protein
MCRDDRHKIVIHLKGKISRFGSPAKELRKALKKWSKKYKL